MDSSLEIITVDKMDRGLAYAEACFETFRVIHGEIFSWDAHAERLQRGMHAFGLGLSDDALLQLQQACIKAAGGKDMLVRLTLSTGVADWGMFSPAQQPVARIQAMPYQLPAEPLRLQLLDWPSAPNDRIAKYTSDYATTLRVLQGRHSVLFSRNGYLISAATANVMLFRDNRWWTPELAPGVLPGVIRHHLISVGLVQEGPCPVVWLDDCAAMAVTASSFFVRPVAGMQGTGCDRLLVDHCDILKQAVCGHSGVPEVL